MENNLNLSGQDESINDLQNAQLYSNGYTKASDDCQLEDIEDIGLDFDEVQRLPRFNVVPKRQRKKNLRETHTKENEEYNPPIGDSIIPGTQKIFVKTWGCSHNNSDSEYMMGQLASYGYIIVDDKMLADLWLLNSCTVKNPSEDHFRNEIEQARKLNKHIVLAGCVPQGQPKSSYLQGFSVVGVQQIDRIVEVVEETLKGHTVKLMGKKKIEGKKTGGASLNLPKVRKNPLIEIIAINTGCLNQCTYCKTKHARGELGSYQPEEIVDRAAQSFQEGVVEIWLTSEDLGAYGKDIGVTLPELLWKLVKVVPEGCMVRLGMTNPPYILEHLEEISKILKHPRMYSFLHVPVQSASDSVLMSMRREYCRADFKHVVDYLKERVPEVTIATDVICGFPGETEEDLKDTLDLIQEYKFPSLFINQFFPRPGTVAAKMERIPTTEVKKRTKMVSDLFNSYTTYDDKVGQIQNVLVTEISHDKRYYVAHNKSYDQVLVPKNEDWMGHMLKVKIISTGKHFLMCEVLENVEKNEFTKNEALSDSGGILEKVFDAKMIFKLSTISLCTLVLIRQRQLQLASLVLTVVCVALNQKLQLLYARRELRRTSNHLFLQHRRTARCLNPQLNKCERSFSSPTIVNRSQLNIKYRSGVLMKL